MAIQQLHLRFSLIQRSKGQSSVASAAYSAGKKLIDERSGQTHDYSSKDGVVHSEITLPDGPMPPWATDRSRLWNESERVQRSYKNPKRGAQPARKCIFSLSDQLTDEARQRVTREWTQAVCNRYGCASDWSIHRPDSQGDKRNHHAHVQFSTNVIDEEGFQGKVDRDHWDNIAARRKGGEPKAVRWARELLCRLMNQELEAVGIDERWDHRTLTEQRVEALRLAAYAIGAADVARRKGDEIAAAEWQRKAEKHARHAEECDREPTKKAGQASINRERQRYRLEHAEAIKLETEARQAAIAAREAGQVSQAEELERKALAHADRAREIESQPTSALIRRDVARYADTPPNGSDRVEMRVRAPSRRNAQRRLARAQAESLAINTAGLQAPTASRITPKEMPVIVNAEIPIPAPAPHVKHAPKSKRAAAVRPKPRAPLQSSVQPWQATPQASQAYKLRLLEKAYEAALAKDLAQYLKYVRGPKGEQLAQLRRQAGIAGGDPWLSITLNDGGRIFDQGDALLVKEQTRVAIMAMAEIACAKGWAVVEMFGEQSFRRDAWLEHQLAGIEAHGYKPTDADKRELDRLREAQLIVAQEDAERRQARDEKDRALGDYYADDRNHAKPKPPGR